MRNKAAIAMIAVSVVMGLAAVVIAAQWLGKQGSMATRKVVVAARDVTLGMPLTAEMLRTVDWPSRVVPDGALEKEQPLEGRVVKTTILRGEPVLESKLAPVGAKGGLSSVIAEGKRAITVKVNEVIGVAGFALPGNQVDVLVNTKDERERPVSKIVLDRILVLAVAQEANRDETKPKVVNAVTLEVTPEQAEKLDLARAIGNLSLVLRNQLDGNMAQTVGARRVDLLQRVSPEQVSAPNTVVAHAKAKPTLPRAASTHAKPAARNAVEIIKGTQASSHLF